MAAFFKPFQSFIMCIAAQPLTEFQRACKAQLRLLRLEENYKAPFSVAVWTASLTEFITLSESQRLTWDIPYTLDQANCRSLPKATEVPAQPVCGLLP